MHTLWTFGLLIIRIPGGSSPRIIVEIFSTIILGSTIRRFELTVSKRPDDSLNRVQMISATFLEDNSPGTPDVIGDLKAQVEADTFVTFKRTCESCPRSLSYNSRRRPPRYHHHRWPDGPWCMQKKKIKVPRLILFQEYNFVNLCESWWIFVNIREFLWITVECTKFHGIIY